MGIEMGLRRMRMKQSIAEMNGDYYTLAQSGAAPRRGWKIMKNYREDCGGD